VRRADHSSTGVVPSVVRPMSGTECGASNECDVETSRMRPWPALGPIATRRKNESRGAEITGVVTTSFCVRLRLIFLGPKL